MSASEVRKARRSHSLSLSKGAAATSKNFKSDFVRFRALKNAMLRQVVLFMAIPIMALIIWLEKTVLANALYKSQNIQSAGMYRKKIYVAPYPRADGTMVSGYTKWIKVKL